MSVLLTAALLLWACDSTARRSVDVSSGSVGGSTSDTRSAGALGFATATELPSDARDVQGSAAPGRARRSSMGSTGPGPAASGSAGGGGAGGGETGGDLVIGVHTSRDLQAAYTALGAQGAEGDVTPKVEAIIAWINEDGGMAGRRVVPVFHGTNALDDSFDRQAQVACEAFTEDHQVTFVVGGAVLPTIALPDCLAKRGVPLIWNYHYLLDDTLLAAYSPFLYQPFGLSADRLGSVYVDTLSGGGYFSPRGTPPATVVGIVRYDLPQHERFSTGQLRPNLGSRRIEIGDEVAIRPPPTAAAAADTAAQVANSILRFQRRGVTHVMFVPSGGALPFVWMGAAEGQAFRPRYSLTTLDLPYFVRDQAPASQLEDALGVGWSPASDVDRPDEPPGGLRELCYEIAENSRTSIRFCDGLFFLKAALERAPSVDAAGLQVGVEGLGESFEPAFSLATRFGPGRHDGSAATRLITFVSACECWRYTGDLQPAG